MWKLDYPKYSPVWCKKTKITPWLIKPGSYAKISQNACYLKQLQKHQRPYKPDNLHYLSSQLRQQSFDLHALSINETLEEIGLISLGNPPGPFIEKSTYEEFVAQADVLLATEKFNFSTQTYVGASRHALLHDLQLKGLGRNSLILDFDISHSNGMFTAFDAFKGLATGMIVTERTKLGEMESHALFSYNDWNHKGLPLSLLLRSADTFRLAQIIPKNLSQPEHKVVMDFLAQRFSNASCEAIFKQIVDNYIHAFSVGVFHRSPSLDNLLVDGRCIDSESVHFTEAGDCYPFYIQYFVPDKEMKIEFEEESDLKRLNSLSGKILLYGSWIHQLRHMARMHFDFFAAFDCEFKINFEEHFSKALRTYFKKEVDAWIELLPLPSRQELQWGDSSQGVLQTIPSSKLPSFGDFKLFGKFYDTLLQGWVLYYSPVPDPELQCAKLMSNLFKLFLPQEKTWAQAEDDYKRLQLSIRKAFK